MNYRHYILFLLLILTLAYPVRGQVEVADTIKLTSTQSSSRIITGVAKPSNELNAANADGIINNHHKFALASGTPDSIDLSLSPSISTYLPGSQVMFFAPSSNTDSVLVNVDGLGFVPLNKGYGVKLDSGDLKAGLVVNAIYDGTQFIILSELNKSCPSGYTSVNDYYCIHIDEQADSVDYWQAIVACADENARLCTWSEWYNACRKLGTSLNNMIDNWEFVDGAQNYLAASPTKTRAKLAGEFACEEGSGGNPTVPRAYRCCYTK